MKEGNRIVGVNERGDIFLVEADSSRGILPEGYELPAHILRHNGKWVVAFGDNNNNIYHLKEVLKGIKFNKAQGKIVARQQGWTDEMVGYTHTYVALDSH